MGNASRDTRSPCTSPRGGGFRRRFDFPWWLTDPGRARRRPVPLGGRTFLAAALLATGLTTPAPAEPAKPAITIDRICDLIFVHARLNRLPEDFFARLIWKESRFDPGAVSPAGAEGIAQFMPGTAAMRGLSDSFDPGLAIPASAKYLGELKARFGNLGLAAAAYNSGENRVSRWLSSGGFLPLETEGYVLDIMGEPADSFADRTYAGKVQPLDEEAGFDKACRAMPATMSAVIPMASIHTKPWGIQVAGNFRRAAAVGQYQRMRGRLGAVLEDHEPVVSRVRSPLGRRGIYAVRIGADSRREAGEICTRLRAAGGSCVVMRNR